MKLNGKIMVAAAMWLGSMAALTGCKSGENSAQQDTAPAEQSAPNAPAAEPAKTEAPKAQEERTTIQASTSVAVRTQAPPPPPAERYENPGRPPSREHTWMKGYWRWDTGGVRYVWEPGHWMVQFAPSAPPAPRYEDPGRPPSSRHVWVKGYWKWSGHDWKWIGGHWDTMRGGHTYVAGHWEKQHGRWHYVPGRWVR